MKQFKTSKRQILLEICSVSTLLCSVNDTKCINSLKMSDQIIYVDETKLSYLACVNENSDQTNLPEKYKTKVAERVKYYDSFVSISTIKNDEISCLKI